MNNSFEYLILITLMLLLLGIIFPRSKGIFLVQITWFILFIGLNTGGADYQNNLETFQAANSRNIFSVYDFLCTIFKSAGLSFEVFNFIFSTVTSLVILYVILKYSNTPALTMTFLYIFPFIDCVIQKRWYYATAFIIIALLILSKFTVKRIFLYVILIGIATQFHQGALLFYTLPIVLFVVEKRLYKTLAIVYVLMIMLSSYIGKLSLIVLPTSLQEKGRLYLYTLASSSILHYLFWIIWHIMFIYIFYSTLIKNVNNRSKIIDYIYKLNIWSLIIVPFYFYDPVFSRAFRPIILFNYIFVANKLFFNSVILRKKIFLFTVIQFLMCVISFIVFDVSTSLGVEYVVFDLFKNNVMNNLF